MRICSKCKKQTSGKSYFCELHRVKKQKVAKAELTQLKENFLHSIKSACDYINALEKELAKAKGEL